MSMREEVELKLIDGLTAPAKQATASARSLLKEISRFRSLSLKANGFTRDIERMTRDLKKATGAAADLRKSISRPVGNGYARVANNLNGVRNAANNANAAANRLNRTLRNGGGGSGGRVGSGSLRSGGRGGRSSGHGGLLRKGFGLPGHVGGAIAFSFGHALAYQATEGVIEAVIESVKTGMEQAFEKKHTTAMLKMQGESGGDIAAAVRRSQEMAKSLPQFTSAQHFEAIAELRPALLGGLTEATRLAPMFQQAIAILEAAKQGAGKKALGGVNTHGEALSLVRALEVKNVTSLGEDAMNSYVDSITKAIVAFNGQIKAEDFHSAFKFSRGDSVNWSKEFSTEILPTVMNELKKSSKTDASQAGNALKSMSRVVMDGVMGKDILARWDALGMLSKGAYTKGKKGLQRNPKFNGSAMIGGDLWQSNPFQWVQNYLLPHMKEHGVDVGNRKSVVAALGGLFGNRVANQIAQILATQQAIIRKDQENVKKAQGTNGLNWLMNADPTARMHVLSASIKELLGALGDLALPGTMRGMKGLINWAHNLTETLGKSAYAKALGGHFEAATAGLFGQRLGRKQFAKGSDHDYQVGGIMMGQGFSSLASGIGKMLRFWEELGVVSGAMKTFGAVMIGTAGMFEVVRMGLEIFRDAIKDPRAMFESAKTVLAQSVAGIFEPLKAAIGSVVGWLHSRFPHFFPDDAKHPGKRHPNSMGKTVEARKHAKDLHRLYDILTPQPGDIWHMPKKSPYGDLSRSAPTAKSPFGFSGFNGGAAGAVQPITNAVNSAVPQFAAAGGNAVAALAGGISGGSGGAVSAMSTLMGSLTAIASKGVTVPVNLDTSGAEAKLNALIAKGASIGSGGGNKPQFSKSLHDTGG